MRLLRNWLFLVLFIFDCKLLHAIGELFALAKNFQQFSVDAGAVSNPVMLARDVKNTGLQI
jgi:hypothetical protein